MHSESTLVSVRSEHDSLTYLQDLYPDLSLVELYGSLTGDRGDGSPGSLHIDRDDLIRVAESVPERFVPAFKYETFNVMQSAVLEGKRRKHMSK